MKLSFKYNPRMTELQSSIIEELSFHTTKLYNMANYDLVTNGFKPYEKMNTLHASNWHKEYLHSHNYQQCLKVLDKNWKSYFSALQDFKCNPLKYKGMPMPPKYKNLDRKKNEIIFTNQSVRIKEDMLMLSLSKPIKEKYKVDSLDFALPKKVQSLVSLDRLQQVKVKYDDTLKQWCLIIIYQKETASLPTGYQNVMAVDLGSTNLAACTYLFNDDTLLLSGKPLKSVTSHVNKQIARLQGISMSMHGSKIHRNTKAIRKLYRYLDNYGMDYLHKASTLLVNDAYEKHCATIVIGDIRDIKQEMDYNKMFVQLPLKTFRDMITYKAKLLGMEVVIVNESYTSGCSALDIEPVDRGSYDKSRRIKRGLFVSVKGILVNADINGSLNILRKYTKCIPRLIESARDKGCVDNPVKLRVA